LQKKKHLLSKSKTIRPIFQGGKLFENLPFLK